MRSSCTNTNQTHFNSGNGLKGNPEHQISKKLNSNSLMANEWPWQTQTSDSKVSKARLWIGITTNSEEIQAQRNRMTLQKITNETYSGCSEMIGEGKRGHRQGSYCWGWQWNDDVTMVIHLFSNSLSQFLFVECLGCKMNNSQFEFPWFEFPIYIFAQIVPKGRCAILSLVP